MPITKLADIAAKIFSTELLNFRTLKTKKNGLVV